jgi:hypothetical protein
LDYVNLGAGRIIGKLIACIDAIVVGYRTLLLDRDLMSQNQDVHLQRETRSKASGPPALLIPAGIRPLSPQSCRQLHQSNELPLGWRESFRVIALSRE